MNECMNNTKKIISTLQQHVLIHLIYKIFKVSETQSSPSTHKLLICLFESIIFVLNLLKAATLAKLENF